MGWSLDGETTIIDRDTLCREFSLDRVTRKDAILDEEKLDWMNGIYIQNMGAAAWVDEVAPFFIEAGLASAEDIEANRAWFEKLYPLVAERSKHLNDAVEKLSFILRWAERDVDEKSVKKEPAQRRAHAAG